MRHTDRQSAANAKVLAARRENKYPVGGKEGRSFIDLETIINTLYRLHDTAKDAKPKA